MKVQVLLTGLLGLAGIGVAAPTRSEPPPIDPPLVPIPREELGRLLFWDPLLSGERDIACATCHHPDFAYADGRALSLGTGSVGLGPERGSLAGERIPPVARNAPTLLNVAFNGVDERRRRRGRRALLSNDSARAARAPMFWDSRVRSLEAQALEPLRTREEMLGDAYPAEAAVDSVVARLRANPEYVALFASAFETAGPIDATQLAAAIAAFERTLVALDSPFDRFRAGDSTALSEQQLRGMEAFDDAGCDRCHEGPMFSDYDLRTLGIPENPEVAAPDPGARRFRFRTPSLRFVALTAPYMHNGTLATLEDVLRHYDEGRSRNPAVATRRERVSGERGPTVDRNFRRVDNLSDREIRDIIAFLEALTDPDFDRTIPERVPSGLTPGGSITPPETFPRR